MPGANVQPDLLRGARRLEHPPDYALRVGGQRIEIPGDPIDNLSYRAGLLTQAGIDPEFRHTLIQMCAEPSSDAMLFWINSFADTYLLQEVREDGSEYNVTDKTNARPFVTWPYQNDIFAEIFDGITSGRDLAVLKTRKMGLSWMILTAFHWFWQFRPGSHFMEVSRKEDLVDNPGDPDSLFWKHDFLIRRQPRWLVPKFRRTDLKLENRTLDCTIIGQSTTGDVGHGGRKTAVLFDEIARMREAKMAWEGASQMTSCRIGNSTPHGPGFFCDIVMSGKVRVLKAPFYDHPIFGRGRRIANEGGKWKITSPWRDAAVAKAVSKREIAENIDMDFMGAGFVFFDLDQIDRHEAQHCDDPIYLGHIRYAGDEIQREAALRKRFRSPGGLGLYLDPDSPDQPWSLWCELMEDDGGLWRPDQTKTYIFGIDPSYGIQAANSTIVVKCLDTGEQVGEYASATVDPIEFGKQIIEAGYWWGGVRRVAFVVPEANGGAGQNVVNTLRKYAYPWMYSMRDRTKRGVKNTPTLGWHSNDVRKQDVLGQWRGALARNEFTPRSKLLMREARSYIWYETSSGGNSVGPAFLEQESAAAEKTHGDRVIGAALAHYGGFYCFRSAPPERDPPRMSFRGRQKAAEREKKRDIGSFMQSLRSRV